MIRSDKARSGSTGATVPGITTLSLLTALTAGAHLDLQHISYKGAGQAPTHLLAGHIDPMFASTQTQSLATSQRPEGHDGSGL
ncbi:MAG: hypothetical protein EBT08_07705 [Betaproteobacteria bacterium]|nr:hypothetical protein [Betaproteobacteria bacterium]